MDMEVYFTGNKKVAADYKGFTVETDQPVAGGGDGTALSPFDLFLVSLGTCAGFFVLQFMQQRDSGPRYIDEIGSPVLDERGETVIGWMLVWRDITEERQLSDLRQELSSMIVHDLRSPLTAIISSPSRTPSCSVNTNGFCRVRARSEGLYPHRFNAVST